MNIVGHIKSRCPNCMSRNFVAALGAKFDGVILSCLLCGFEDYVANPFGDHRIFLDAPRNWCLVYASE